MRYNRQRRERWEKGEGERGLTSALSNSPPARASSWEAVTSSAMSIPDIF
jgi:hypothetical protein